MGRHISLVDIVRKPGDHPGPAVNIVQRVCSDGLKGFVSDENARGNPGRDLPVRDSEYPAIGPIYRFGFPLGFAADAHMPEPLRKVPGFEAPSLLLLPHACPACDCSSTVNAER